MRATGAASAALAMLVAMTDPPARRWIFCPALRGGRPVAAWMRSEVPCQDPGAAAKGSRHPLKQGSQ